MISSSTTRPSGALAIRARAALLTAPVSSAIATMAIVGPDARRVIEDRLRSVQGDPVNITIDRPRFALWHWLQDELPPEHVVVVALSDQRIELSCHGGPAISRLIIETLRALGCQVASGDELIDMYTGLDDEQDAIQCAARAALAQAPTLKVAAILIDQWQGALSRAMDELHSCVTLGRSEAAEQLRSELRARARFGLKLLDPWRLTLAGPPNVGKSSLTNALCGSRRVLVHEQPGTTRDAIETTIVVHSWPLRLIDTAGVRDSIEAVEQMGIAATHARWQTADIGLLVVDSLVGWTETHDRLIAARREPIIVVLNKMDQCSQRTELAREMEAKAQSHFLQPDQLVGVVSTSAKETDGVQSLQTLIGEYLDRLAPPMGSAVPFLPLHVQALN